ncbi:MAG TPA: polysaccharide deacetylase family protein [Symbiobacteriaceae bacterium]|jgi:peptidoglycan/xylan/chitin deacetylase (PgdA/CDA1 family)
MQPDNPVPGPGRNRRDDYRKVLTGFTALLVLGLLAAALFPNAAVRKTSRPEPRTPAPPATTSPTIAPIVDVPVTVTLPPPEPKPATKPPEHAGGEMTIFVEHGDRACKQIALTYDAGSAADGAAAILAVLKKQQVTATFFLTGKWVESYPALAKRIAAEGHTIANHTYDHQDLTKLTPTEVLKEVRDGETAIARITGKETRPLFREPYGAFNNDERRLVRQAGFTYSVYWDVDTLDWQFPPLATLVKRLIEKPQNGSVVLMHLNVPETALASDQAIPTLREKGYKFVTIPQVLKCGS